MMDVNESSYVNLETLQQPKEQSEGIFLRINKLFYGKIRLTNLFHPLAKRKEEEERTKRSVAGLI
jgi:hypothetical protein